MNLGCYFEEYLSFGIISGIDILFNSRDLYTAWR